MNVELSVEPLGISVAEDLWNKTLFLSTEDSIPADDAGTAVYSVFGMSKFLCVVESFLSAGGISEGFFPPNHQLKNEFVSNMTFPSLEPPPPKVLYEKRDLKY